MSDDLDFMEDTPQAAFATEDVEKDEELMQEFDLPATEQPLLRLDRNDPRVC